MSSENKRESCVRCKSYLFPEDDTVYCPVCGAPHHRECYNALGHCALEELHGTESEYSRQKQQETEELKNETHREKIKTIVNRCEMCGEEYDPSLDRCPKCSAPDLKRVNGFAQFDFLGGVPADYDLGEGVTAEEAKRFVAANTHRYIPKFAILNKKNKFSWNWMAFLFPEGWWLSRKMYKGGIVAAVLTVMASFLTYPFSLALYNLGLTGGNTAGIDVTAVMSKLPEIGWAALVLALIGVIFELGIRVISALLGDYVYKNHTISTIKAINADSEDKQTDFRKKGGVSMWMFFLGLMLVQYGSLIITMFV